MTTDTLRESAIAMAHANEAVGRGSMGLEEFKAAFRLFMDTCKASEILAILAAHDADKARIAVLEEALRPFALAANNYDDRTGETPYQITIGQLRAARAVLTTQASEVE